MPQKSPSKSCNVQASRKSLACALLDLLTPTKICSRGITVAGYKTSLGAGAFIKRGLPNRRLMSC